MKQKDLQELFTQYCKAMNVQSDRSQGIGEKYIAARKGTFYLVASDSRAGNNWAIVRNNGDGTIGTHYGYVSAERMAGYIDACIALKTPQHSTHELCADDGAPIADIPSPTALMLNLAGDYYDVDLSNAKAALSFYDDIKDIYEYRIESSTHLDGFILHIHPKG